MVNLEEYLSELFYIPPEKSLKVGLYYHTEILNHELKKHPEKEYYQNLLECKIKFQDIWDNYWLKFHQDDPQKLRESLAKAANYSVTDLPLNLMDKFYSQRKKDQSLFHNTIYNDYKPDFNYYFDVIFEPYFQKIKNGLIFINPLFSKIEDYFLKRMIVAVISDYQAGFYLIKLKHDVDPPFIEKVLYHGFNLLHSNTIIRDMEIDDDSIKTILSELYMIHCSNKVA